MTHPAATMCKGCEELSCNMAFMLGKTYKEWTPEERKILWDLIHKYNSPAQHQRTAECGMCEVAPRIYKTPTFHCLGCKADHLCAMHHKCNTPPPSEKECFACHQLTYDCGRHNDNPSPRAEFAPEVEMKVQEILRKSYSSPALREALEVWLHELLRLALRGAGR